MNSLTDIYSIITKNGIRKYKYNNSKNCIPGYEELPGKKGVTFAFRSKKLMSNSIGFVMGSEEAILENTDQLSHWTPNIFSWGGYTDKCSKSVKGFYEKNLQQINTFVIDFDCSKKDVSSDDILIAGLDLGIMPTLILETPNGFQAYFVLKTPSFVSSANDYKSLRTSKAISRSLKVAFSELVPGVDFGCNPFGIFRFPTKENVVYFNSNEVHDFTNLMLWSKKVANNHKQTKIIFSFPGKKQMTNQTKMQWFDNLLTLKSIKGGKGLLGRNSAIFTASLACFSSGMDQENCIDLMDEFNSYIDNPVPFQEVKKTVKSAYSGKYKGASKEYITLLSEQWDLKNSKKSLESSLNVQKWYKFAKDRNDRKKSHYSEWKNDLIAYINEKTDPSRPYIKVTREQLMNDLKIPKSSLKDLLNLLKSDSEVYISTKLGRNGFTRLATSRSIAIFAMNLNKELKEQAKQALQAIFPDQPITLEAFFIESKIIINYNLFAEESRMNSS